MLSRVGVYWHLFPTYNQGKKVAWDGITSEGREFLDAFPKELVVQQNNTEQKIRLINGSIYQIVVADKLGSLRGPNPVGIIVSEYAEMNPRINTIIEPIQGENNAWIVYIFTPKGKNHAHDLYINSLNEPEEFTELLKVSDTKRDNGKPVITEEYINGIRRRGTMSEEQIQQEYYCSFESPVIGAYYGKQMMALEEAKQICDVPWQPDFPVHTAWDIGVGDPTSIWFWQDIGKMRHMIEYYESEGEGVSHYAKVIHERPYAYGIHWGPFDLNKREWGGDGRTQKEIARGHDIRFRIVNKHSLEDGIDRVRNVLPSCVFDRNKCKLGIEALRQYRRASDEKKSLTAKQPFYLDYPYHDWSSNGADAFRYFSMAIRRNMDSKPKLPRFSEGANYNIFAVGR